MIGRAGPFGRGILEEARHLAQYPVLHQNGSGWQLTFSLYAVLFQGGRACGRHATSESASLVAGHRFPRDIILLAVRYYLQLGAAAERIAGILAASGIDVSGRTILR